MKTGRTIGASVLAGVLALWPILGRADPAAVAVIRDRVYRVGVYLVVDALVQNQSPRRLDRAEASVEFYDFFDQLISVGHAVLRPVDLEPGHVAMLEVVMPAPGINDPVRKIRYRFTWQAGGQRVQAVAKRDVWAIGQPTRDP